MSQVQRKSQFIISLRPGSSEAQVAHAQSALNARALPSRVARVQGRLALVGSVDDRDALQRSLVDVDGIHEVDVVMAAFPLVARRSRLPRSTVRVGDVTVGADQFTVMAGPCAVESETQIFACAQAAKRAGATILRGGAYKPRSSPYDFQGLHEEGLELLGRASKHFGLKAVTELLDLRTLDAVCKHSDILQIGARNMQNTPLLVEAGRSGKPVLLKRGLSSTINEWLLAAEYVAATGNDQIILCERGIRTFEPQTRNTLDLGAVTVIRELTHLPVIVDPSHASGRRDSVIPLARAAVAVGADGVIVEFHPDPAKAWSDGPQSLTFPMFEQMMKELTVIDRAMREGITPDARPVDSMQSA